LILSFGDKDTEDIYHGRDTKGSRRFPPEIINTSRRKLDMIAAAYQLNDLRVPPGNRLEALKGRSEGFFSVRINDQRRIIFRWEKHDASEVQIIDYH
jgi:proteic killer suppression protein